MTIPFFSLADHSAQVAPALREAFENCLASGTFVGGTEVESFEREFSHYLDGGASSVIGVGNGLDALRLILLGLGIGPGDEVIVPGFTFIATWLAVAQSGATIVPVDVSLETANIQAESINEAITPRTRAIIIVHLYGRIALSKPEIQEYEDAGIFVIEDAAQAHGASIPQGKAGTLGTSAAFSFYPTKNLGCLGDGGAVVTKNTELANRVRALANYGAVRGNKYYHEILGWNSRLDSLQAAFLRCLLPHLDEWTDKRRTIARHYSQELSSNANLSGHIGAGIPVYDSVWHHFVIKTTDRDNLIKGARLMGIGLDCHYPYIPLDLPAFNGSECVLSKSKLHNSRKLASTVVSLPIYPELSIRDQDKIASVLQQLA